jgi:hypothetical protein
MDDVGTFCSRLRIAAIGAEERHWADDQGRDTRRPQANRLELERDVLALVIATATGCELQIQSEATLCQEISSHV